MRGCVGVTSGGRTGLRGPRLAPSNRNFKAESCATILTRFVSGIDPISKRPAGLADAATLGHTANTAVGARIGLGANRWKATRRQLNLVVRCYFEQ